MKNKTIQELTQEHMNALKQVKQTKRDIRLGLFTRTGHTSVEDALYYCDIRIANQCAILALLTPLPGDVELCKLPTIEKEYHDLISRV